MKAAILIVGDDPALLETRAALLKAWHVTTTTDEHAIEAIRSTTHDLIIFCQTIPDATAQTLIEQAREMNPHVVTLALKHPGQERILDDAKQFEVQITKPERLLIVVDRLLQSPSFKSSDEERVERT
jgi:DNA-binding NtrC family response regulator